MLPSVYISRHEDETNIEIIGRSTRLGFQFTSEGNSWALVSMNRDFNGCGAIDPRGMVSLLKLLMNGRRK